MKQLAANWMTEGQLDFEYKKYILLAYLQDIDKQFKNQKLYPFLSDLIEHYETLVTIKENKQGAATEFPKRLRKLDIENFKLEYERIITEDKYMEEIQQILDFSIPAIKGHLDDGTELYEFVERKMEIFPVGVVPLNAESGYLLLSTSGLKDTRVYMYEISLFEKANERYRGIRTEYMRSYLKGYTNTYENIKIDLIKKHKALPNPATYAVESKLAFPVLETMLPVAKRWVVRLATQAGDYSLDLPPMELPEDSLD